MSNTRFVTYGDFIAELNRWLTMKWRHADRNEELPKFNDLWLYFIKLFNELRDGYAPVVKEYDAQLRKEKKGPALGGVNTILRITPHAITDVTLCQDNMPVLSIVTHCDGATKTVFWVSVRMKKEKEDGKTYQAPKEIILPDCFQAEQLFEELFRNIVSIQHASYTPLAKRWEEMPESFRAENLICPNCGSSATVYDTGNKSSPDLRETCPFCGWESVGTRPYRIDFADLKFFLKEKRICEKNKELEEKIFSEKRHILYSIALIRETLAEADKKPQTTGIHQFAKTAVTEIKAELQNLQTDCEIATRKKG